MDPKGNHHGLYKREARRSEVEEGYVTMKQILERCHREPRNVAAFRIWKRQGADSPLEPLEETSFPTP